MPLAGRVASELCPGLTAYPLLILPMFPHAVLSSEAYDDFLSHRFSWPTKAAFACRVQCSVRIAHPAVRNRTSAGNIWHSQRPPCPISAQRQADREIARSTAQRSDTAGTRLARPRTAVYAEGAKNTPPSYPKRRGQRFVFWISQAVAAAARTRPFPLSYPRNDRTASISAAAGLTPRWTYIILYCSGLCG